MKNEADFVDEIELIFKQNGFYTFREVIPDQCQSWEKPFRVDLIVQRNDIGVIGIEAKYLNTLGQGSVIAEAFEQIKKYKDYTYLKGNLITKWCIAPKFDDNESNHIALEFIQRFFNYYNISFLTLSLYSNKQFDRITIDKNTKQSLVYRRLE